MNEEYIHTNLYLFRLLFMRSDIIFSVFCTAPFNYTIRYWKSNNSFCFVSLVFIFFSGVHWVGYFTKWNKNIFFVNQQHGVERKIMKSKVVKLRLGYFSSLSYSFKCQIKKEKIQLKFISFSIIGFYWACST